MKISSHNREKLIELNCHGADILWTVGRELKIIDCDDRQVNTIHYTITNNNAGISILNHSIHTLH